MSKHIGSMDIGDTLECKGPIPKLPYKANMKKAIGMVRSHVPIAYTHRRVRKHYMAACSC